MRGRVVSIYLAEAAKAPMRAVAEARAVAGKGLEGDRNFDGHGTFTRKHKGPHHELTLIESEAVEAALRDYQLDLPASESRRNVVTRGVALNHLVGKEFRIGEVRLRGLQLCEPCSHLEKLTKKGVRQAFRHRGGLRAQILETGTIRAGDEVVEPEAGAAEGA